MKYPTTRTRTRSRTTPSTSYWQLSKIILTVSSLPNTLAYVQPPFQPSFTHSSYLTSSSPSYSNLATHLNLRDKPNWFDENPTNTNSSNSSSNPSPNTPHHLRFLGKGPNAIVRPGVVLIAPTHEYHHFLMKSAIFIHAIGLNEYGEHVTRGVIIDHPTAFTMGEMSAGSVVGVLGNNILFQGGDQGASMQVKS